MNPTDEHQGGANRPNFMSASRRPSGNGDNILARLERDRQGSSFAWTPGVRVGAVVGVLVAAALIWILLVLTRERMQVHPAPDASVVTRQEPALPAPAPVQDVAPTQPVSAAVAESLEPVSVAPALADIAAPALASAASPAATAPPRAARSAIPARAAAQHGPRRTLARAAPPPRASGPRRPPEAIVDSDVALLSAILIHAPRHSAERARAQSRCAGDLACQDNVLLQEALKATD